MAFGDIFLFKLTLSERFDKDVRVVFGLGCFRVFFQFPFTFLEKRLPFYLLNVAGEEELTSIIIRRI